VPPVQAVPSGAVAYEHDPPPPQVPGRTWQFPGAVQVTGVPPHAPAVQVSPVVQASPSSHVPDLTGLEQTPVLMLHVPAEWHWSGMGHVTAVPAVQTPAIQASPVVHALPSSHGPDLIGLEQAPVLALHVPAVWHWSGMGHVTVVPAVHTPL